jgi:NAD dependent epimerase/dehydratase family enzyme
VGSGEQWVSWIGLADAIEAYRFLLRSDALAGAVNVVAPNPVTNAEFTHTLAAVLGRPALLPMPRMALALLFGGEMVDETLLASQRVVARRLLDAGFEWREPTIEAALRSLLARA